MGGGGGFVSAITDPISDVLGTSGGDGGQGGAANSIGNFSTSGPGGTSITADLAVPGGKGNFIWIFSTTFGHGATSGSSYLAGGVSLGFINSGANGTAGNNYGGGGAGAINIASQGTARSGGKGGDGIVIVELYA